MMYHHFGEGMQ